ncbi:hypothetical protein F0919_12270 [Taibaiella lutea]|uniref:Uncharacterized protein n=1 Tax=Taibaiella lutea TaxID=2608001 RepID=A0A5M6CDW6_9BACT|nr:hypothetical protein [Taibaiella lutea]KAA5533316.1 hypothetical protein F0919_12270 [Taibaiella lutea]
MKKTFITSFFMIGFTVAGFSQTINPINTALMTKAQVFTNEVMLNCHSSHSNDSMQFIANAEILTRIEVTTESYQSAETYKLLSTVALKNKCNPSLTRDELNFNPSNFNPLKYFLNWYPGTITKYRVDNTNYVIIVHPKL